MNRAIYSRLPEWRRHAREARQGARSYGARERCFCGTQGDECGRYEFAGKSVAVPVTASFVIAERLRLFHGGPAFTDLKFSPATPGKCAAVSSGLYGATDLAGLAYVLSASPLRMGK
jgi:hypothetical protein